MKPIKISKVKELQEVSKLKILRDLEIYADKFVDEINAAIEAQIGEKLQDSVEFNIPCTLLKNKMSIEYIVNIIDMYRNEGYSVIKNDTARSRHMKNNITLKISIKKPNSFWVNFFAPSEEMFK